MAAPDPGRKIFEIAFTGIIGHSIFLTMALKAESKNKDKINTMWFGKS